MESVLEFKNISKYFPGVIALMILVSRHIAAKCWLSSAKTERANPHC